MGEKYKWNTQIKGNGARGRNACIFRDIAEEFGSFADYLWGCTQGQVIYENDKVSSPLSDEISKDLRKRGMTFVGTTIIYSYLQAVGVINSHEDGCFLCSKIKDVNKNDLYR